MRRRKVILARVSLIQNDRCCGMFDDSFIIRLLLSPIVKELYHLLEAVVSEECQSVL